MHSTLLNFKVIYLFIAEILRIIVLPGHSWPKGICIGGEVIDYLLMSEVPSCSRELCHDPVCFSTLIVLNTPFGNITNMPGNYSRDQPFDDGVYDSFMGSRLVGWLYRFTVKKDVSHT